MPFYQNLYPGYDVESSIINEIVGDAHAIKQARELVEDGIVREVIVIETRNGQAVRAVATIRRAKEQPTKFPTETKVY